jgi:hypothetical protein
MILVVLDMLSMTIKEVHFDTKYDSVESTLR